MRIGDENEIDNLRATSVVSTGYGPGTTIVGGLGVLGPTRMDYPGTIATVRAVARYVGDAAGAELTSGDWPTTGERETT